MAHHPGGHRGLGYPDSLLSPANNAAVAMQRSFDTSQELYSLQAGMEMLGFPPQKPGAGASDGSLMMAPWPAPNHPMVSDFSLSLYRPPEASDTCRLRQAGAGGGGLYMASASHAPAAASLYNQQPHHQELIRSSRYLTPAQDLLKEFCHLPSDAAVASTRRQPKSKQWEDGGSSSSSSSFSQSLHSFDILELQRMKAKLYSMLEEVDRRHRRYCEQMRGVVASLEAVAGEGAAKVYTAMASKTMSRHFRCLRDGIVRRIQETRKALGEKDPGRGGGGGAGLGTSRGETPRLKMLDQCLRQQKALQQAGMMESHPWRPQRGLPERSVSILRAWLFEHFLHPYPSDVDKHILARQTGLSRSQVSNWFINARVRLWKPMVEEMYREEMKDQDGSQYPSHAATGHHEGSSSHSHFNPSNPNPNSSDDLHATADEQKPGPAQLLLHDPGSLASILNSSHRRAPVESFGTLAELDFGGSYGQDFRGHGGVSLTLGLQQHDGSGMSLSFSPAAQAPLLFSGEQLEAVQPAGQFGMVDGGGEAQDVQYRNLMGAQLLHDLAG